MENPDNTQYRILVVDDQPESIQFMGTVLRRNGFPVSIAQSGAQALKIIEQNQPDLILLDILMPEMDGLEVCRRLKANVATRDIPIIFLSALTEVTNKVKAFDVGAVDYVPKPTEPKELLARVNTHLTINSLNRKLQESKRNLEETVRMRTKELWAKNKALRESEEKFKTLINNLNVGVYRNTPGAEGKFIEVNPAMVSLFGFESREELLAQTVSSLYMDPAGRKAFSDKLLKKGSIKNDELQLKKKDGTLLIASVSAVAAKDEKGQVRFFDNIIEDITERKGLESQFLQSQKMESVGKLAGGVAHDFNNMLSVIQGYAQLALSEVDPKEHIHGALEEILKAAKRSGDITRQLLAFARKQTIAPKVLDLNETLEGMLKMLRMLIGENIDLAWQPGTDLWPEKMDPAQIDQILANLCVNARDAIDGIGKVTIETENVVFDEAYCAGHMDAVPGEYVMLAVSDNGRGMDKETLSTVFEPFFTTKEVGKGTGLGLSTVYGIVKQNQGFINVYSEPGKGTTFKIYLPRHKGEAERGIEVSKARLSSQGRGETIVVVEDDTSLLELARAILEREGYDVLTTQRPGKAIDMVREYAGDIHLLITDVVMPEMNGKDLAEEIIKIHPNTKTLFMSGYTSNVIAHHGILEKGVHFIEKPFRLNSFARMVREVIEK